MSTNPIIGRTDVAGIQVSTVYLRDRGWWESCLFDDRKGYAYGNSSRVVEGYGSEAEAISGHRYWSARPVAELANIITPSLDNSSNVN